MNYFHVKYYVINFPSFYSAFSVLHIFIISFSTSVLFSKRRISVNLVDLVKSFPTRKKEAKGAAPGRRQKALSGDKGTQNTKKASVAPKEK